MFKYHYCSHTDGFYGQKGHLYLNGLKPFVEGDMCLYGCGCEMHWHEASGPEGINPYRGCPKNPNDRLKYGRELTELDIQIITYLEFLGSIENSPKV